MKTGDQIARAFVETRSFTFEGFGVDEDQAVKACYRAWKDHVAECRRQRPHEYIDKDYVKKEDISVDLYTLGKGYRDKDIIKKP